MAITNFANQTNEQVTAWSMKTWRRMREVSFLEKLVGSNAQSEVQRISELTKSRKGTRAVFTLIADSTGDGVAGDRQLKGNEEALRSSEIVVTLDQLRHAHTHEGVMADQKSIVNFRNEASDNLAFWHVNRQNQLAMLHLSGISHSYNLDGSTRVGSDFSLLEYAGDVSAPTANRNFRVDAGGILKNNSNANLVGTSTNGILDDGLTWDALLELKAQAEYYKLRPVRTKNGVEYFRVLAHPLALLNLKKTSDYKEAMRHAMPRSESNELFKGTNTIYVDGLALTPSLYCFHTKGAASGSKWGGGTVDGSRLVLMGAQALAMADIGGPSWKEEMDDYDNRQSIAVGKIYGFKKPVFEDPTTGTDEDFGVMTLDVAI